ncbi:hypothetical protein BX616_001615 [Lobosporangium transversale]|nr:hypothetical protein BX616_001615 [Lobosporangium transversale]
MNSLRWLHRPNRSLFGPTLNNLRSRNKNDLNCWPLQNYYTVIVGRKVNTKDDRSDDQGTKQTVDIDVAKTSLGSANAVHSKHLKPRGDSDDKTDVSQQRAAKDRRSTKDEPESAKKILAKEEKKKPEALTPKEVEEFEEIKEVDGEHLHTHLIKIVTYQIFYAKDPIDDDEHLLKRNLGIFGKFNCKTSTCNGHSWQSACIATYLRFSKSSNSYKVTLYAQSCRKCERYMVPAVDAESYCKRVCSALDLWKDVRDKIICDRGPFITLGPHQSSRCYGCKVGKCRYPFIKRQEGEPAPNNARSDQTPLSFLEAFLANVDK